MDMCLCWYDDWFCYHLPTHSLLFSFSSIMCAMNNVYNTIQQVSITAHISIDTFPIDSTLQQVLRCVCAYNALYSKGKYTERIEWVGRVEGGECG